MTERQNKNHEPTTVDEMRKNIAEQEMQSSLDFFWIQGFNQLELAETDFPKHFAITLLDSAPLGTSARMYVAQHVMTTPDGKTARTVYAVLEEFVGESMQKRQKVVGRVVNGVRFAEGAFDDDDLDLGLRQLDDLQQAVNDKKLFLDPSLGAVRNIDGVIEHGF